VKRFLFFVVAVAGLFVPDCPARDFPFYEPLNPPRPQQVMAHRGEAGQAPENTLPALERCIEDGLEWAEIDLRLTKDGRLVLSHDPDVDAGTNGIWRIDQHSFKELARLDVGSSFAKRFQGVRLPSLGQCFDLARGKLNLYLDCKDVNPEQLAREILDARMERQVVVYDRLDHLRRVARASTNQIATMAKWHPGMDMGSWAGSNLLSAVEINADEITAASAKAFHALGLKVQTKNLDSWDRPAFSEQAAGAGADWVQTDRPEEFLAHALWRRHPPRPVRISHHRGANRYAPENTLPAFEKSIRMGADFVEFDVRATVDGALFLLHDGDLDRTTEGSGPIRAASSTVVAGLSAGSKFGRPFAKVKVPTLEAFLSAVEGRVDLYFDAKAIAPEALAEAVERHQMAGRTVVYQQTAFLIRLKQIDPRIRALPPLRRAGDLDALAAGLKPYAVDAAWDILSRELIDRCHRAGILVFSDALGDHERIEDYLQAIDWGIDLIQTNYPLRVMRALELLSMRK